MFDINDFRAYILKCKLLGDIDKNFADSPVLVFRSNDDKCFIALYDNDFIEIRNVEKDGVNYIRIDTSVLDLTFEDLDKESKPFRQMGYLMSNPVKKDKLKFGNRLPKMRYKDFQCFSFLDYRLTLGEKRIMWIDDFYILLDMNGFCLLGTGKGVFGCE